MEVGIRLSRKAFAVMALFATTVGCSAQESEGQTTADARLLLADPNAIWSSREVPYCFIPQGSSPILEQRKQEFRQALAQSWGAENVVRFTERGCDGNTVQVSFKPLNGAAGYAGIGRGGGLALGLQLDTQYLQTSETRDFKWVVAHEMGHVLGFSHEQDQRDSTCNNGRDFSGKGVPLTVYDPESVMNYCASRTVPGSLTALDREGLRRAYGGGPPPPPPPGNPGNGPVGDTQPIHRSFNPSNGDHMQGLVPNEGAPDWHYEGVSFNTWTRPIANGGELFRCRINGTANHFLSTSASCEGHVNEGHLGFVSGVQTAGTFPIYRCVNGNDHISTLSPDECQRASFLVEGIQGYALR